MMCRLVLSFFISIFILLSKGHAQQSAQAEMKIYVRVLEGKRIINKLPKSLRLNHSEDTDLGFLEYDSHVTQNTIFNVSRDLFLTDINGHQIHLKISGQTHFLDDATTQIRLIGSTTHEIQKGLYRGALKSVVEYL